MCEIIVKEEVTEFLQSETPTSDNNFQKTKKDTFGVKGVREMSYAIDVYLLNSESPSLQEFSYIFKIDCVRMMELADIYVTLNEKVDMLLKFLITRKVRKEINFKKRSRSINRKEKIKEAMNKELNEKCSEEEEKVELVIVIEDESE